MPNTFTRVIPTGNGVNTSWLYVGAASAWEAVADGYGTPNDSTYAYKQNSSPSSSYHYFTSPSPAIPGGDVVVAVRVLGRGCDIGGDVDLKPAIYWEGTRYESTTVDMPADTPADTNPREWLIHPVSGTAWTPAQANVMGDATHQFGANFTGMASGEEARVMSLVFEFEHYTPTAFVANAAHWHYHMAMLRYVQRDL